MPTDYRGALHADEEDWDGIGDLDIDDYGPVGYLSTANTVEFE